MGLGQAEMDRSASRAVCITRRYLGDYKQSATAWDVTEDGTDTTV